ncbi:hypothetical protein D1BOALGB6SA_9464 [Olavius sp. associated proteobacterium Delta 1]|nr:hypothetical protein D1BOALGB6SA_9464 [Olavius sp. associated proteobacterium Delta 1]
MISENSGQRIKEVGMQPATSCPHRARGLSLSNGSRIEVGKRQIT